MYFACNMPHYSPYELVNPAKMAAVAGFLPSYLDFSDRLLVAEYLDRNREYYHLRIHPGNLHTDPISVWHYAELLGIGAANYALGALMIVEGAALCTSGFGCVAAGMAVAPGLGAFGTGFAFHYGLIVELKHQHVIEWGP